MLLVERLRLWLWLERVGLLLTVRVGRVRMMGLLLVVRVGRVRVMGQVVAGLTTRSRTGLRSRNVDISFLSPSGHDPSDELVSKLVLFIIPATVTADQVRVLGGRSKVFVLLKLLLVLVMWVVMMGRHRRWVLSRHWMGRCHGGKTSEIIRGPQSFYRISIYWGNIRRT